MKFQRENAADVIEEMTPLLKMHYEEIAHYKDIKFEPDFEKYIQIDQSGALRVFTVREDDGAMIGYGVFFIKANPHYKSSLQAVQDVVFMHPEKRGTGGALIKYCDEQLKDEGVQVIYHHIKAKHNFGSMLERMGYELVDLIYAKRV